MRSNASRQGSVTQPLAALLAGLVAACAPAPGTDAAPDGADGAAAGSANVRTGIDVLLAEGAGPLRGLRVGLITNHTGLTADGASTIDALHGMPDLELVALFGPEHGLRGSAEAGEHVADGRDERTGLPIHSLYGETRAPTPAMLQGLEALAFDIQDIGTRYYTYVWTMALALQAAGEAGIRFVVLDRPNPIGGDLVHGNVLEPEYATFVGLYPVPMRHGFTAGELARWLNAEHGFDADLHVVPVRGWQRSVWYDETGLDWVAPSPSMPSLESAAHYPGTCLFEGTSLSVGRGTDHAFQQIGAPWLDAPALVARLRAADLPGVAVDTVSFTPLDPSDGKFGGESVRGIRYTVTDRAAYDPVATSIETLVALRALHPEELTFIEAHFDRLSGTDAVRLALLAGGTTADITATWPAQIDAFDATRVRYLLY